MQLAAGATFAGYKIVRLLGSGGMGEVYLAGHPRLPREDALKVLPVEVSTDADYRSRFIREADLAAKLWHPNIVGVHDRGEHDRQLWIAMDFVDGRDASQLLAKNCQSGMPVDEVVNIVTAVADALDYAHKRGMLHRDVKPANIMLASLDDDGQCRILLADFGIARPTDDIGGLTATNMTIGTVAYAAPEQLMGDKLDGRADQYALAATAYHLLTGSQLFPHSNPAVVIGRHLNAPLPSLADSHRELVALDSVLAVALAKSPADRFNRCADFASAFTEAALGRKLVSATPTMPAAALQKSTAAELSDDSTSKQRTHHSARSAGAMRLWLTVTAATILAVGIAAVALWRPWQPQNTVSREPTTITAPPATTATAPPTPAFTTVRTAPNLTTTTPTTSDEASSTSPTMSGAADSQFLNQVRGINYTSLSTLIDASPNVVVKTGRAVCTMLDEGYGFEAVEGMVLDRLAMYGDNRSYYAGPFGVYAVAAYCPQHQADSGFNGNY